MYADLLVTYALGHGAGIKRGEVVNAVAADAAKPLYMALCRAWSTCIARATRARSRGSTRSRSSAARLLSRITRFMANTLYDENAGGPFGNTHIALAWRSPKPTTAIGRL